MIARTALWLLATGSLAACVVDRTEVGPTVHVRLQIFSTVTDTDVNPMFTLGSETSYQIDMAIDATAGTEEFGTMSNTFPATAFTGTATVPGVTIADSPFVTHEIVDDREYDRMTPLGIPGTAKGSTLTIHADATDARGLASNAVNFTVALR